jgi:hypothetical protein
MVVTYSCPRATSTYTSKLKISMKKKIQNKIHQSEIPLAAIHFAICDLATAQVYPKAKSGDGKIDLQYAWSLSEDILISEVGTSGGEERKFWEKEIRKGSEFCNEEWAKDRNKFI